MRAIRVLSISAAVLGLSLATTGSAGDKLQDFEEALKYDKGCNTIPYPSQRDDCRRKQDNEVKPYCNETSCQGLGTRSSLDHIKRLEDNLRALSETGTRLKSLVDKTEGDEKRRYESELADTERRVGEQTRAADGLRREVDDKKRQIAALVDKGEKCREARIDVVEIFTDVADDVDDESDPAIRPKAQELLARLRRSTEEHTTEIVKVQTGINNCKEMFEGRQ